MRPPVLPFAAWSAALLAGVVAPAIVILLAPA
jgi:hypothetical protein